MKLIKFNTVVLLSCATLFTACKSNDSNQTIASLIIKNGNIYTANDQQPTAKFIAVTGDLITYVGDNENEIISNKNTKIIDLQGQTLTPGLIEGHGHILGIGYNEMNIDLLSVKNYDELLELVKIAIAKAEPGQWIVGHGWHQNKWDLSTETTVQGFPTHHKLSAISPNNPIYLTHASKHASLANAKAMEIAGVEASTAATLSATLKDGEGGEIIADANGFPTGVFVERASGLITKFIPANDRAQDKQALKMAQEACLRLGITGFHDAGQNRQVIDLLQELKIEGQLPVRMYVMLTGFDEALLNEWYEKGPMIDSAKHTLDIRSVKLNCDGALGSRGAWLLEPYSDRLDHYGHETIPMAFVERTTKKALQHGFQVCAHAIGDRANREILDRYELAFNTYPEKADDHRFRIEHAQHLNPDDIGRFAELNVIPAMQAIHMASDRPWAIDRLGEQRIVEGAYVWQKLLQSGVKIVNGTDAPVEPLNPLPSFYASVSRRTLAGTPEGGYEPDQKMTRDQALKSYTIDAAYGAFMENEKGSIELGKLADFTVFDKDIMTISEDDILKTKVMMTIIGGDIKYQAN